MKLRNRRLWLLLLSMSVLLSACANAKKSENIVLVEYAHFASVEEMYQKADFVIKGKVIKSRVQWLSWVKQELATIYTVEILGSYKGFTADKTMELLTMGGETATAVFRYEPEIKLSMDTEYVMFLSKSRQIDNAVSLIAGPYALYRVDENGITGTSYANKLTLEDLKRMQRME